MYCNVLAYVILEVEKSHDLPSASWRLRKASDVESRWLDSSPGLKTEN